MVNSTLDKKLFELNKLSLGELEELQEHFSFWNTQCGKCESCLYRHHIIELYVFEVRVRLENRRKNNLYERAEQFVKYHYLADSK